jgi:alpha-glucuronidase
MVMSRREFLASGVGAAAAVYAGRCAVAFGAAVRGTPRPQLTPLTNVEGEDGAKLWLRYAKVPNVGNYQEVVRHVAVEESTPTMAIARKELLDGLSRMIGLDGDKAAVHSDGILHAGTPRNSTIKGLQIDADLARAGEEGYIIRSMIIGGKRSTVIASVTEVGVLRGAFHFLRLIATMQPVDNLNITECPAMKIRMANHWDNLDGTVERGYAGLSITFAADAATGTPAWDSPAWRPNPRLAEYGRALASLGMNGVCLNNVNASAAILNTESLKKVVMIGDVLRPYGVKVFLAANFAAPRSLGQLPTADPNDRDVQGWWRQKADDIYKLLPDFGGLLVKANSEGQPGPKDYNRTHAEGANCLALALAPHGGVVIWRAFVYDDHVDADRVKRCYKEFTPLDGQFLPNVLIQIKNGPLDFQPREPFNPLFGALAKTSFAAEVQPSQEYLGQAKHLVYLGTMWEEFLQSETYAKGPGSSVAKVLRAKVQPVPMTGMAGVLNPGLDPNWTGHHFSQANWYALGRLGWNPDLTAAAIAEEWTRMTFTNDADAVRTIVDLMMGSRETFVNYTMPLGLHHMIGGDHYAPQPENARAPRSDWTAVYYHQADKQGIGFDRTRKGDDYVDQYLKPLSDVLDDVEACPGKLLLWFHHLPWDFRMKSGKTLWSELTEHYDEGVTGARNMQRTWAHLEGKIDLRRFQEVSERLNVQVADALTWRNHILGYFGSINGLPVPDPPKA